MRILKKIDPIRVLIRTFIFTILFVAFLMVATLIISRVVNYYQISVDSTNGIQKSAYIDIGGIKQYIQIRGENKNNPIILVIHGGPGSPMSYYSYYWQTDLEDEYTIVQWDQRGSGRTYYKNGRESVEGLSSELLLSDLDELVNYLRERFRQEKIIIMGHSWGTVLGTRYTQIKPSKVSAYIGVGQMVNSMEGEQYAVSTAFDTAKQSNAMEDASRIQNTSESYWADPTNMKKLNALRGLTSMYLPNSTKMSSEEEIWMGFSSPYMDLYEIEWYLYPNMNYRDYSQINEPLINELFTNGGIDLKNITHYDMPVYYISGDCDWTTPVDMVSAYYQTIQAPDTDMILITDTGHSPFLDKPKVFCRAVKQLLDRTKPVEIPEEAPPEEMLEEMPDEELIDQENVPEEQQ